MTKGRQAAKAGAPQKSAMLSELWFAILCGAALFAPWLGGQFTGPGPAAARALACAAGIAWVVDRWGDWRIPRPAAWLWLFTGWAALTALQGNNWHDSLMMLSSLASWAALATLAADAAREPKRRDTLVACILVGLLAVSAQGVWDGLTNIEGWRVFGPFATPNLYAGFLATLLPLALLGLAMVPNGIEGAAALPERFRLTSGRRAASLVWYGLLAFGTAVGLTALFMTASKGAVLALAVAFALVLAAGFWRRTGYGLSLLVVFAVCALVFGGGTLLGRVGAAGAGEAHSAQFRVLTWKASADMALDNPVLGTGIGTFGSSFNRYAIAGWTEAAHNAYLQTAAETGFVGLLLFLAALGSAAVWLFRAMRSEDRTVALLGAAGLAALLAAAAHNLVDYGWTLWAPSAALWMLVGLGVGGIERSARPLPRPAALAMLLPFSLALLGGILVANAASLADPAADPDSNLTPEERVDRLRSARALDLLDADLARKLGFALARAGLQDAAVGQLEDAVRLAPGEPTAWRFLGEAYLNTGRPEEARRAFERGLENAPNALKLLSEAARLAEASGRREEALGYHERIIRSWEGPAGRYAATPELVPVEPIRAYAALAAAADAAGRPERAREYRESLVALADLYEGNLEKHPLIWQATGQDDPRTLEEVRALRAEAGRRLAGEQPAAL